MIAVVLTIHVLIVLALIGVVLLQRSEGGALGIGGSGPGGGFMSGRGAANALTRTTSILAALFFATSLGLAVFSDTGETDADVVEGLTGERAPDSDGTVSSDDLLRRLEEAQGAAPEPVLSDEDEPLDLQRALEELTESDEAAQNPPGDEPAIDDAGADAGESESAEDEDSEGPDPSPNG